jgi:hypothetical protein
MIALYRYIANSVVQESFRGHAAEWGSWCIANLLTDAGYSLKVINWKDDRYKPRRTYDLVFDIRYLNRLKPAFRANTAKVLHLTASDDIVRNKAEYDRVAEVNARRGCKLKTRRTIHDPQETYESIDLADIVILIGNEVTKQTYPEQYWDKIKLINTPAAQIGDLMATFLYRYIGFDFDRMPNYKGHGTKWTYKCIYDLVREMG